MSDETRFVPPNERSVRALEMIAEQLVRLNESLDAITGCGADERYHLRVVDMGREPW